ncbi:ATP-binding response regulator [Chitinophaga sp.]|uniref:ATP-binding response regulator n=1 Tax=Chitinophaga sp. TaxID=1869181 RepID=UPI002F928889
MNLLKKIPGIAPLINAGTSYAENNEERKGVVIVNCLSLSTAALVFIIGFIFEYLLKSNLILIPVILEFLAFSSLVYFNHIGKLKQVRVAIYVLQCICATYFGMILGPVIEIQLLIVFLIMAAYLITDSPRIRRLYLGVSIAMLILTEINFYYNIIPYIHLSTNASFLFRWLAMTGILTLILQVINFYDLKNKSYQRQLEKSDQSKSIFVKQISHEIRTPLNGIFGIAQLLKEDIAQHPEHEQLSAYVNDLIEACYDARLIVNNVLDLAEIEKGKMHNLHATAFELEPLLNRIVNVHKYVAASREVTIAVEIDPELPAVIMGDEVKLKQMLNNLLSNAIKFTERKTTIQVKATRQQQKWLLSVQDNGKGISEEKLEKIFEPFVKTEDQEIESTGLGLYITHQLAELLKGSISVKSSRKNGTVFILSLPLLAGTLPKAKPPVSNVDLHGLKALVIEDNPMSQKILVKLLEGMGANTTAAQDGLEGLTVAQDFLPDIIFVDANMPVMNGDETIVALRKDPRFLNTLIIAVTADGFNDDGQTMIRAGANELIPKPIAFVEVRALLRKHLASYPVIEH